MNNTTHPLTLTKQRLARELGRRTRLSNANATSALEAMIAIITEQLAAGGRVEIANFLTLDVQYRTRLDSEQTFWNNQGIDSGKTAYCVLRCRPGKQLRLDLRKLALDQR